MVAVSPPEAQSDPTRMHYTASRQPPSLPSGPFVCTNPDCGKSFLRKEHLNRHMVIHTNSRPHKCFICGRTFARSDILNRHVLQHNVPPDGAKRTPLACQTCRRRKTKCDSNHPCSTCADTGEPCVREPSSMQAFMPTTRTRRKSVLGDRVDAPEQEDDADGEGTEMISSAGGTPPLQPDWVTPISMTGSSVPNKRPASVSVDQDPLLDPSIAMMPGMPAAKSPSVDLSEAPSLLHFTFESPPPRPSEAGDPFPPDPSSEMQMSESPSFTSRGYSATSGRMTATSMTTPSSTGGWQLTETVASQAQFVATQIKLSEFEHFHQAWPFLHVPTFTPEKQTTLLTSALANLSMWMQNTYRHHLIPYTINQELTRALMPKITEESWTEKPAADIPLQTLQALVITLIYSILGDAPASTLNWAAQWTDMAISTFRQLGVLHDQWLPDDGRQSAEERWVLCEQMKRLVFAVLRIDAYLSIILNRPPTMRYQEIGLPLPVSEGLWKAETRVARTQLHWSEPAGRARSAFCTMMRDGLDTAGFVTGYLQMPHLSLEDNHFSICSFLSELWGVCKEAHEEHHRHYRSPERNHTADQVKIWKVYLREWREHLEKTDHLEEAFYAQCPGDSNHFLGLNLTLYHLVSLKLHANLRLLEQKKCCAHCQEIDVEDVINTWAQSSDARQAVYHAAQLKRIYEHESMLFNPNDRRLGNPLGPAGLLASAVVLCLYSAKITGVSAGLPVGVSTPEGDAPKTPTTIELAPSHLPETPEFEEWITQGGLVSVDGVPLNAFSLPRFSLWYREQLTASPVYSSRLIAFLLTLTI
ncbi:Zn(II)2Cys6 transcription factor domain-containing protein [Aspergillus ibericus CBS 121593]|uniref:C2H2 type zinc finger domain protein n=1 Tax=Aspergillus ibericus CBS 121593 TaxID=1448316 RepID=A0A395GTV0_9EURO|nr:hypothetical protein BO80DRAFT_426810 [Aspergillus ibericus CBS 121593]RAK99001.1 hypothetical protein BO80DRAFT_426810 [Aspergillus ibericus CBS 121593]